MVQPLQNNTLPVDPVGEAASFWATYGDAIVSLGKMSIGILVYALIVNAFYQIISHRVMFAAKMEDGRVRIGGPLHGFAYLMLFPLVSFLFFLMLSLSLIFLNGGAISSLGIFTIAMAIVLSVRVAAYFSEATSHDVAKMLPLGLLGVAIVRAEFTGIVESFRQMTAVVEHIEVIAVYFGIVVVAEFLLRSIYLIIAKARGKVHRDPAKHKVEVPKP